MNGPGTAAPPRATRGLPVEVTSFVGRRHEIAEVKRLLAGAHLVTLTGVGGVGKSRLARRVAAEVQRAFPDGVSLVELADLESSELLVQATSEALRIHDHSRRTPLEVLVGHLRDRRMLIVLDNCEHLLRGCAALAQALMRSAPDLRILATSRQPLGVAGEQMFMVPTLSLPDRAARPSAPSDAVMLFAERAAAVVPDFQLTEADREVVERICRRLDGIALAIELAAVRLRILSTRQLLDRLDDRFKFLVTGSANELPRHQTLRALIDWSYALCTDQERLLWARASVFSGGLDLAAAEEVCVGEGILREEIVEVVAGLVDKSIFVSEDRLDVKRYRLLETVRQYGRERLIASGEEAALRRRHRDYYQKLAAQAQAKLVGPDQVALAARLHVEHANLRVALEFCFTEPGEARAGVRLGTDLLYHWITGLYLGEGRRWLDHALAVHSEEDEDRARALWADGWLAVIQNDIDAAAAMLDESRAIGERLGLESVLAYVALYSGMIAMCRQDTDSAIALYEEAVARHRATGDQVGLLLTLIRLSLAHSYRGDAARAVSTAQECLAVSDLFGERWARAYATMALGVEAWRQGDIRHARELEQESLRFHRTLDDPLGSGVSMEVLCWIAAAEEDHERAARLVGALETVWNAVGAPLSGFGHLGRYRDACRSRIRGVLGDRAFEAAVDQGAALSYEEALSYALEERPHTDVSPAGGRSPSVLTPREMEVARLVAQGMRNKDIAAKLVIAHRTAEGHVERIMTKLGFASRAQIAAWVTAQSHPDQRD
ncbi:LuxR family transcriptional regulator [Actinoallomurus liliacearum]|uniref:LuxR family transcriptional regulator n=1 Tax=Actinoallomurus liliacearum TaxID=1080073 RepID=A0ABP8TU42_9ACTN